MNGIPMLNVDLSTSTSQTIAPSSSVINTSNLTVGTNTSTPLTPEILNSVMAMTNPLEYSFPSTSNVSTRVSQVRQRLFFFSFKIHVLNHLVDLQLSTFHENHKLFFFFSNIQIF